MKKILLISIAVMCFSCTQNTREQNQAGDSGVEITDMHTAENSLDYWGSYRGVLPSGSGEGIETVLVLRKDNSYILKTIYLGRDDNAFEEKGSYSIEGNLLTLKNPKDKEQYFKIGENHLTKLDEDRQVITGALADKYVLQKQD